MRQFQNLTCFSIFVVWTNPLSSECAKTIIKMCRKQNLNITLQVFENKIFSVLYEHFGTEILNKISFWAWKNEKKIDFFRFSQNDPRLHIWSLGAFRRLWDISNPIPFHSWSFWSIFNHFFKIECSTLKMLFLLRWALNSFKCSKYEAISKSNLFFNFCRMNKPFEFWMRKDHYKNL